MLRLYATMRKRSRRASMTFGIYNVTEAEQITSREAVPERHDNKETAE